MLAKYRGWCKTCHQPIVAQQDEIVPGPQGWVHVGCQSRDGAPAPQVKRTPDWSSQGGAMNKIRWHAKRVRSGYAEETGYGGEALPPARPPKTLGEMLGVELIDTTPSRKYRDLDDFESKRAEWCKGLPPTGIGLFDCPLWLTKHPGYETWKAKQSRKLEALDLPPGALGAGLR